LPGALMAGRLPAPPARVPADSTVGHARRISRQLRSGGRVLDVGSPDARLLRAVAAEATALGKRVGGRYLVPWPSPRARRGRVASSRVDELALRDQMFDVVWAGGWLHCAADPVRAARELARVTLPGGTLFAVLPGPGSRSWLQRAARDLRAPGPLRAYLDASRGFDASSFVRTLEDQGCTVTWGPRVASPLAPLLGRLAPREPAWRLAVARLPGPRTGRMPIEVHDLPGWTPRRVERLLAGLPVARGYRVVVKPLRYRTRPHVQAWCEFDERRITIQVPVPFRPFTERIPYRARRLPGKGLRFAWSVLRLRFDRPHELIRYLYLHEYYHWYLREVRGRPSAAETACDRFALQRM